MRRPDMVRVDLTTREGDSIRFDRFTSLQIVHDLTAPIEASFEVGDDGSWPDLARFVRPGTRCRVFVNDRPRCTGRIEANDAPLDVQAGASVRFTVRTKLSDAMYASADHSVKVRDMTIFEFLAELYRPLGGFALGFVTDQAVVRDLMTGKFSADGKAPPDLERIDLKSAQVRPPETIYDAADRHLRRHGLMHWDAPDGTIVVGRPNDEQAPSFRLCAYRDRQRARANNITAATRTIDWSGVPSDLAVYGSGGGRDFTRTKSVGVLANADVIEAGMWRPVTILAEGVKNRAQADRAAAREMSARLKRKDAWDIEVDGLSYWDGAGGVPYANDLVCEVVSDVVGGPTGAYYLPTVTLSRDASSGDKTNLTLVQRGLWRL